MQSYSNNKKIYSVALMIAYLNMSKRKSQKIKIHTLKNQMKYKAWGDPVKNIFYSPRKVIKNPHNKKYKDDLKRIKKADLTFPIIMSDGFIVDGMHRLTKAYLINKKEI